eukprot:gnl/MRDRNA2_/MRDRNA2_60289_c0_seq1.p1 gnl/MRDRNA2_/MRDRNA2_60289_c0~~gnl/MRDRNA2_/MRDRNA2_60289_c0_seq1.p1  ORF type:complete len:313 (+),score=38.90 gnl/MRDRNA2_/MRDRNA2_60289_c0_seq1:70-1008(+)
MVSALKYRQCSRLLTAPRASLPVKVGGPLFRCFSSEPVMRLKGKVAIVTGASSGIGLATSKALASEGMTVVMVSRSVRKLADVKDQVPGSVIKACNVVEAEPVHHMVGDIVKQFGRVDVLANCAGVMYFTLMRNLQYNQWQQTIDTNCTGTVNVCGAVLPHMLTAQSGHIVNVSSDAARQIFPALAVYNASKAFVNTFSKSLRGECVGTGIRVTDIQPGDTATNLVMENTDTEAAGKVGVSIGEVVGTGFDRGSILDPSDVADAIVYAVTLPQHVGMHEMLVEPRDQMYGDPTAMGVTPGGLYAPQFISKGS